MKGRENSIWNRLMYGTSHRFPEAIAAADEEVGLNVDDYSEKQEQTKGSQQWVASEKENTVKKPASVFSCLRDGKVVFFFAIFCHMAYLFSSYMAKQSNVASTLVSLPPRGGLLDSGYGCVQSSNKSEEVIGLAYPFIPKASYGEPVHSVLLIDHKFDSWYPPAVQSFTPPKDTDYNKVVLTLNVSVDGVQFDRLGHLYVGGAEVWRTSTIEPGARKVHSSFKKDLTEYVSLFKQKTDVVFELNNLVTDDLTGVFHVKLSADFYLSEYFHSAKAEQLSEHFHEDEDKNEIYKYFDVRGAASKVYPFNLDHHSPVTSFPSQKMTMKLPKVSQNTTRLKLNIFASGNSFEEDWYNSVFDEYVDRFKDDGTVFNGHGPLRFITVWLDGKKLASQAPQPFIFTGGFSPSLWRNVVPINAFDLPSIDLDISPILPYLWDSEDHELSISVENALDELKGVNSRVSRDWLLGANLLTYEKSGVKSVSGEVLELTDSKKGNFFGHSLPYTSILFQTAEGKFETSVQSHFLVELNSGEVLNTTMASFFSGKSTNVQNHENRGKKSHVVHTGNSQKSFSLKIDEEEIRSSDISLEYVLTYGQTKAFVENGVDLNVSLVNVKSLDLLVDKKSAMKETNVQNGTSVFHIRDSGNYGVGSLLSKFKSVVHGPNYGFRYKRRVNVEDNEITEDKESFKHS